jgi:hypothetical protein
VTLQNPLSAQPIAALRRCSRTSTFSSNKMYKYMRLIMLSFQTERYAPTQTWLRKRTGRTCLRTFSRVSKLRKEGVDSDSARIYHVLGSGSSAQSPLDTRRTSVTLDCPVAACGCASPMWAEFRSAPASQYAASVSLHVDPELTRKTFQTSLSVPALGLCVVGTVPHID